MNFFGGRRERGSEGVEMGRVETVKDNGVWFGLVFVLFI